MTIFDFLTNLIFTPTTTGPLTGTLTIPTSTTSVTAQLTGHGSPDHNHHLMWLVIEVKPG